MKTIIQEVIDQREQIQDDLLCMLDGLDDEFLENVCQMVVDRFKFILDTINENKEQK